MIRRLPLLAVALLMLGGCSMMPDFFGDPPKPPIPGKRISVLEMDKRLSADPKLDTVEVKLPRPYVNRNWPQAGGYPTHAMYHLALGDRLRRVWAADIGTGADSSLRLPASPVVADGRVFALDSESRVTALDASNGRMLWRVDLTPKGQSSGALGGGVAFDRGRVYAATAYGDVYALEAATGHVAWKHHTGVPFRGAPTISDGRLFILTQDNQIHALNQANGKEEWSYAAVSETAGMLGEASPAVADGIVVAPFSSGELVALRSDTGRVLWDDSLVRSASISAVANINDINGRPVIDRGRVFAVGNAGRMVSIDLASGERVWERPVESMQQLWVGGDFIYVVSEEAELVCLSRADGRIRWVQQLPRYERPTEKSDPIIWRGPVLASDRLVLVSNHGKAISVSPYTGQILGEISLSDPVSVPPVVANRTLFLLTDDAELVAFR